MDAPDRGSQAKGAGESPHLCAPLPVLIRPAIETNCGATAPFPLAFPFLFHFLLSPSATLTAAFNGQYKDSTHARM